MKKLILIRHAKSDWSVEWQLDFERWLSKRWLKQIKQIWKIIDFFDIQKIICSSSCRTFLTYNWLSKKSSKFSTIPVEFDKNIYDIHQKNVIEFVDIIRNLPNDLDSIAFIGHNSIFDNCVEFFTGINKIHIPTMWIIEIVFDTNIWNNIYKWKIKNFITPKK